MKKVKIVEGDSQPKALRLGIIVSRFNAEVTEKLLQSCLQELSRHKVRDDQITIYRVPGAFEIPVTVKRLLDLQRFDCVICLGAVIRGETAHFDYVCDAALTGIAELSRQYGVPVINGILTTDTEEQAMARAIDKPDGSGCQAAATAIEMVNLFRLISA